jgi:hypothetical protein
MLEKPLKPRAPSFVVLRETAAGAWRFLGEVRRKPGLAAQAARTQAILEATGGKAKAGEVYAAVLASEWRVAQKWGAPSA